MASVEEEYPVQNNIPLDLSPRSKQTKLSLVVVAKAPIPGEAKTTVRPRGLRSRMPSTDSVVADFACLSARAPGP